MPQMWNAPAVLWAKVYKTTWIKNRDVLHVWYVLPGWDVFTLVNQPLNAVSDKYMHVANYIYCPPKMLASLYYRICVTTNSVLGNIGKECSNDSHVFPGRIQQSSSLFLSSIGGQGLFIKSWHVWERGIRDRETCGWAACPTIWMRVGFTFKYVWETPRVAVISTYHEDQEHMTALSWPPHWAFDHIQMLVTLSQ